MQIALNAAAADMPDYKTRTELIELLREAMREQGISQDELANTLSEKTDYAVRQANISAALSQKSAKLDYLREAMANELLGGNWERDVLFWRSTQ